MTAVWAASPATPSDNIFACLALAEAENATGREPVAALVVAYEIQMRLQDAANLNKLGWDQANYVSVTVAAAAAAGNRLHATCEYAGAVRPMR